MSPHPFTGWLPGDGWLPVPLCAAALAEPSRWPAVSAALDDGFAEARRIRDRGTVGVYEASQRFPAGSVEHVALGAWCGFGRLVWGVG